MAAITDIDVIAERRLRERGLERLLERPSAEELTKAREAGQRNEAIARLKPAAHWNQILSEHGLRVISSREIRVVRLQNSGLNHGNPVVCYTQDPDTFRIYRHGAEIGLGLLARHEPKCLHLPLTDIDDIDWGGLTFKQCPDCGQLLSSGEVVYRPAAARVFNDPEKEWGIRRGIRSGLWKDVRKAKIHHKHQEDGKTIYVGTGFEIPRFAPHDRRYIEVSNAPAPEIDQRRREAAFREELKHPPYRAPHQKVLELRNGGFDINQIARKLKVSPSTIDNRLRDVPDTARRVDLLTLRVKAGGGYSQPEPPDSRLWDSSQAGIRRDCSGSAKLRLVTGGPPGNHATDIDLPLHYPRCNLTR